MMAITAAAGTPSQVAQAVSSWHDVFGKLLGLLVSWFLWHGNIFRALQVTGDLVGKAIREFDSHLRTNAARIPNYGERYGPRGATTRPLAIGLPAT